MLWSLKQSRKSPFRERYTGNGFFTPSQPRRSYQGDFREREGKRMGDLKKYVPVFPVKQGVQWRRDALVPDSPGNHHSERERGKRMGDLKKYVIVSLLRGDWAVKNRNFVF